MDILFLGAFIVVIALFVMVVLVDIFVDDNDNAIDVFKQKYFDYKLKKGKYQYYDYKDKLLENGNYEIYIDLIDGFQTKPFYLELSEDKYKDVKSRDINVFVVK